MMGRPHRAVRVDENQSEIILDLRKLGAYIWPLSNLGGEVLDLLVCWRGRCIPVEIKAIGCEGDLTDGEREGIQRLQLVGIEPIIATCAEDVLEAWGKPSWQVVDQAAVEECNELMAEAMEKAARLTKYSYASPYQKERICGLRDTVFRAYDAFCASIEKI